MASRPVPKPLTEAGWKAVVQKFKLKDTTLQKQLFLLTTFDGSEFDDLAKGLASVIQFANAVKKSREACAIHDVTKYLAMLISAAEAEQRGVAKDKAIFEKAAVAQKKTDAEAKQHDKEDQKAPDDAKEALEAREAGEFAAHLMSALMALKSTKDAVYEFVICDAKPPGIMVAKKISPSHKAQLTKLTAGTRFLPIGSCTFTDGKFNFNLDNPVPGLARKVQAAIKNHTGKKLPILAGNESAGEDDEPTAATGETAGAPAASKPELSKAPQVWQGTRDMMAKNIKDLKTAVQKQFGNEPPRAIDEFNASLAKLDSVVEKLDNRLADSLAKANTAQDLEGRRTELKNSKVILAQYLNYVKSEPLIAHIDANPFGVKTNLREILAGSLNHMAQAIG
jgi:hypothetical protein